MRVSSCGTSGSYSYGEARKENFRSTKYDALTIRLHHRTSDGALNVALSDERMNFAVERNSMNP